VNKEDRDAKKGWKRAHPVRAPNPVEPCRSYQNRVLLFYSTMEPLGFRPGRVEVPAVIGPETEEIATQTLKFALASPSQLPCRLVRQQLPYIYTAARPFHFRALFRDIRVR